LALLPLLTRRVSSVAGGFLLGFEFFEQGGLLDFQLGLLIFGG
jgi:hypothetical protein